MASNPHYSLSTITKKTIIALNYNASWNKMILLEKIDQGSTK
jgi:hypothetical protein